MATKANRLAAGTPVTTKSGNREYVGKTKSGATFTATSMEFALLNGAAPETIAHVQKILSNPGKLNPGKLNNIKGVKGVRSFEEADATDETGGADAAGSSDAGDMGGGVGSQGDESDNSSVGTSGFGGSEGTTDLQGNRNTAQIVDDWYSNPFNKDGVTTVEQMRARNTWEAKGGTESFDAYDPTGINAYGKSAAKSKSAIKSSQLAAKEKEDPRSLMEQLQSKITSSFKMPTIKGIQQEIKEASDLVERDVKGAFNDFTSGYPLGRPDVPISKGEPHFNPNPLEDSMRRPDGADNQPLGAYLGDMAMGTMLPGFGLARAALGPADSYMGPLQSERTYGGGENNTSPNKKVRTKGITNSTPNKTTLAIAEPDEGPTRNQLRTARRQITRYA